ncbi:MAG TPA: glycosyltransferase, partial [Candidatus Saccharimonadales bacterium]
MLLIFTIFGCLSGLELLIWLRPFWKWHQTFARVLVGLNCMAAAVLLILDLHLWTLLLLVAVLYRLLNLWRLVKGRTQPDYLYGTALRTSLVITCLQAVVLSLVALSQHYQWSGRAWLYILAGLQLVAAIAILTVTMRNLRTIRAPKLQQTYADHELPTLTVALPARNETSDLEACLQSLTASTYPKLEILVLDDCSQDKRTPGIIRDFAHAGVQFIAGAVPPEHWLA